MRLYRSLFVALILAGAGTAYAQSADPTLEAGFGALLRGDRAAAKAGFEAAAKSAPEGSYPRWLGERLSRFAESLPADELPSGDEGGELSRAFGLLAGGSALEAQAAFLGAAVSSPEGSGARRFTRALARVADEAADFRQ